jgi:hypothetical protein
VPDVAAPRLQAEGAVFALTSRPFEGRAWVGSYQVICISPNCPNGRRAGFGACGLSPCALCQLCDVSTTLYARAAMERAINRFLRLESAHDYFVLGVGVLDARESIISLIIF